MEAVIVALIGAAGSAIGGMIGIFVNTKLITYRIEQLESKVNKHTGLMPMYFAECTSAKDVVDKTATCTDFKLTNKACVIFVHFKYGDAGSTPTLNINGTGAKKLLKSLANAESIDGVDSGRIVQLIYMPGSDAYITPIHTA